MVDYQVWKMDRYGEEEQIRLDLEEAREKAMAEGHAEGRAKGHAEGRAEGRAEGHAEGFTDSKLEIARKMKEMGDSVERIHAITNLPLDTIEMM
jgi:predicted transposase YdaD